jgi:transposase
MTTRNIDIRFRIIIVELMNEGHSTGRIQEIMKVRHGIIVSKRGIQKIVHKFKTLGTYEDKKRSGRPSKLPKRSERIIRRICLKNRRMSISKITGAFNAAGMIHASRSTVNRILIKYGLKSHYAVCKPLLNGKQRKRRVEWARDKQNWDIDKWSNVVFSDESMFRTYSHTRSEIVRRFDNERLSHICTKKVLQHGAQVHVWGSFSRFGVGILKRINGNLNSKNYQDLIVNNIDITGQCLVFPLPNFIFQQDNAPCHRSASTVSFLKTKKINILDWPANSPDVNPIENLWGIIKRKINNMDTLNSEKMWIEIQKLWYNIPSSLCRRLVDSMPRRVSSIIKMKGYHTKY